MIYVLHSAHKKRKKPPPGDVTPALHYIDTQLHHFLFSFLRTVIRFTRAELVIIACISCIYVSCTDCNCYRASFFSASLKSIII
jgi:hypothetical protein